MSKAAIKYLSLEEIQKVVAKELKFLGEVTYAKSSQLTQLYIKQLAKDGFIVKNSQHKEVYTPHLKINFNKIKDLIENGSLNNAN